MVYLYPNGEKSTSAQLSGEMPVNTTTTQLLFISIFAAEKKTTKPDDGRDRERNGGDTETNNGRRRNDGMRAASNDLLVKRIAQNAETQTTEVNLGSEHG